MDGKSMSNTLKPYSIFVFDINGYCNASCPWCDFGARKTGILSDPALYSLRPGSYQARPFTTPKRCTEVLHYLLAQKMITPDDTCICLYNWGEPLLNPHLETILRLIRKARIPCELSTNSSIVRKFSANAMSGVYNIKISMSGFSDASYKQAHGFSFERIRRNILENAASFRAAGLQGAITLIAHLYRHNLEEVKLIRDFARELGAEMSEVTAYMTSLDFLFGWCEGTLSAPVLERARTQLFLPPENLADLRPEGYICPQWEFLCLDYAGNLSLGCCCRCSRKNEYAIAPIENYCPEQIRSLREAHPTCVRCRKHGIDYYLHNTDLLTKTENLSAFPESFPLG
jgi:pyruvate-formate lyase-activating enzyme